MTQPDRPIYLDCNATTPIDPRVRDVVMHYMEVEFGNAGSRTHIYGQEAAKGVKKAREQIAAVVDAQPDEVIFTSGATEANNLAILGLAEHGEKTGKRHIIGTQIEHKAVLEPLEHLAKRGFEIDLIPPLSDGYVDPDNIAKHIRDDTLLVSVMHVNNETGIIQPVDKISQLLSRTPAFFHVDSAQGFGKDLFSIKNADIDMISVSSHKMHGPPGIGCLITRKSGKVTRALRPRQIGGGQERSLRSGTIPTALACGFGKAAELAIEDHDKRLTKWKNIENQLEQFLNGFQVAYHGSRQHRLGNTINFSIGVLDSEALILALKPYVAIATGSACTSEQYQTSHVIRSMYGPGTFENTACRASWSYMTPDLPIGDMTAAIQHLL